MLPRGRLAAYYFSYFAFIGAFSPYFSLYLQSLSFSAWDIGLLMSLLQVMRMIAPYLWGWLSDRAGRRVPIVRVSAAVSVLAFCGFFFTTSFAGIFAAMVVLAAFWGAALPLVESITLAHLREEVGRYGAIRLWGSIGFILAVLGVGYALDMLPIRSLLWISVAVLGGILACALALPEAPPAVHAEPPAGIASVIRRPEVAALLGGCFAMSAAHGALYVFYSIYLVDAGYSKASVGWLWTLGVLVEIGVFFWMPALTRRFSLRSVLLFSFGCAVLRFLLIGWFVDHPAVIVFAQTLHGATFGAYHAAAVASINRWFSGRLQARGQALYSSISFGAGGMFGGIASGYAWDAVGPSLTYTISSAFALAGLLVLWKGWRGASSLARVER